MMLLIRGMVWEKVTGEMYYFLYKTTVLNQADIERLRGRLNALVNNGQWNFDLEDTDKVLRIMCDQDIRTQVEKLFSAMGYLGTELDYLPEERQMSLTEHGQAIVA